MRGGNTAKIFRKPLNIALLYTVEGGVYENDRERQQEWSIRNEIKKTSKIKVARNSFIQFSVYFLSSD